MIFKITQGTAQKPIEKQGTAEAKAFVYLCVTCVLHFNKKDVMLRQEYYTTDKDLLVSKMSREEKALPENVGYGLPQPMKLPTMRTQDAAGRMLEGIGLTVEDNTNRQNIANAIIQFYTNHGYAVEIIEL
jgi:hypothetical protein